MTRMQAIATARTMYEGGWKVEQIRSYLRQHGIRTSWTRVKTWVDPEFAEEHRRRERDRARRKYRERNGVKTFRVLDAQAHEILSRELATPVVEPTPDLLLALRVEDGLTYRAIAKVAARFFGMELTESQMRHRLHELGVPKNPNKARPRTAA